ncbi:hypothetical protein FWD20_02220 [Candidatus Saccharibacteria bacterium]|nr:hypothetical protein [Candidatus Saccharibacteria bacterium]
MGKQKNKRFKPGLWIVGAVAGVLVIGAIAFKVVMTLRDPGVLGSTTVSVTVTCVGDCTEMVGELVSNSTGMPIPPDSSGEYNVTDPNVTVNTTIKGAAQMVVTITNSAYPASLEIFNEIFSSGDPAFDATGDTFEILQYSGLASLLQVGKNVLDFYVTSSINSPAEDIHRQLIINYTLPGEPGPEIIDSKLTNKDGNNLPYVSDSTTDMVANRNDLPLNVNLEANNLSRVQLTVTDSQGNVGVVYDGTPLAPGSSGYATYIIKEASGGIPGLKIGRNVITLTVTGLNGETLVREWVVYYWPDGVEPPNTGTIQFNGMTIAVKDLLISAGIAAVFITTVIIVFLKKRKDRESKTKK